MKKFIYTFSLIFALFIVSCDDSYLDETPMSSYAPSTLLDDLGLTAQVVGLQERFYAIWAWTDRQGWLAVWQLGTDVASPANNPEGVEVPYYEYAKLTPADAAAAYLWRSCYSLISNANNIITAIEKGEATASDANKVVAMAEAKFFRGYAYNMLSTSFGGVPLNLESVVGAKTDFVRASLNDVLSQIVLDLTFAAENLPEPDAVASAGRANKYMAMQTLGEVYLKQGKPAEAVTVLNNIINSGAFSLTTQRYGVNANVAGDCFNDMFIQGNSRRKEGNKESIWTMQLEKAAEIGGGYYNNTQHRRVWVPAYYALKGMKICDSLGGRGLGRLRISSWVTKCIYQDGDMRNSRFNIRRNLYYNNPTSDLYGTKVDVSGPDSLYKACPYTTKWNCFDPTDEFGWASIKDWIVMRLGETYLLLAEAYLQQNELQKAADAINVLRERAFPNFPEQGKVLSSDIDMDFILDERARELIGEENRRMTLMRTKTLVQRAKLNCDKNNSISGLSETHLLLPIPLTEIQLNKDAVLEQNPGYSN